MSRDEIVEKLLNGYTRWYDIERTEGEPLVAKASFHQENTGYIMFKKAQMWAADRFEYVYLYSVPHLTATLYEECLAKAVEEGSARIDLNKKHMSTNIVAVFVADQADDEALKSLKKCRIHKSFQFSLKGWMEVHTALVETGTCSVIANFNGRNTEKFLKNILGASVRGKN